MRLCLLESTGYEPTRQEKRILARLNKSLVEHNLCLSLKLIGYLVHIGPESKSENPSSVLGPLALAGHEFHGFVPGCSPASLLISMKRAGWPRQIFWEHDLKAAFETVNLQVLHHPSSSFLGIPHAISLALAVMGSSLVERRGKLTLKTFRKVDFPVASSKQFPGLNPGVITFSHHKLIQGSPLSPILCIIYMAASSLIIDNGSVQSGGPNNKLLIYGDNIYSQSRNPPGWIGCSWKEPVMLGLSGRTLGLDYRLDHGRLVVASHCDSYSRGVQRKLDETL